MITGGVSCSPRGDLSRDVSTEGSINGERSEGRSGWVSADKITALTGQAILGQCPSRRKRKKTRENKGW